MAISLEEVQATARLARLQLNPEEIASVTEKLSTILDMIVAMEKIDTSQVQPCFHPLNLEQRLREDTVTEKNQRELFQRVAPKVEVGLYLVPQVIE